MYLLVGIQQEPSVLGWKNEGDEVQRGVRMREQICSEQIRGTYARVPAMLGP